MTTTIRKQTVFGLKELPLRVRHALMDGGVQTLAQLAATPRSALESIPGIGEMSVEQIASCLKGRGLTPPEVMGWEDLKAKIAVSLTRHVASRRARGRIGIHVENMDEECKRLATAAYLSVKSWVRERTRS